MLLSFTKMHGAGNDFVVIDATRAPIDLTRRQWRALADRHFGVGADQILIVQPAPGPDADFGYRIINADGGEVEQCGNGARAFVRYVTEKQLTEKTTIRVATLSGIISPALREDGLITVDMGPPRLSIADVPFSDHGLTPRFEGDTQLWPLEIMTPAGLQVREVVAVSMGNPHAVQLVDNVDGALVLQEGMALERHPRFPNRVNVGFMQIVSPSEIRLRVYERGAGETLACGTGACAAVVSGVLRKKLWGPVRVHTRGGWLEVEWKGIGHPVQMTGDAASVYEGTIDTDRLQSALPVAG